MECRGSDVRVRGQSQRKRGIVSCLSIQSSIISVILGKTFLPPWSLPIAVSCGQREPNFAQHSRATDEDPRQERRMAAALISSAARRKALHRSRASYGSCTCRGWKLGRTSLNEWLTLVTGTCRERKGQRVSEMVRRTVIISYSSYSRGVRVPPTIDSNTPDIASDLAQLRGFVKALGLLVHK